MRPHNALKTTRRCLRKHMKCLLLLGIGWTCLMLLWIYGQYAEQGRPRSGARLQPLKLIWWTMYNMPNYRQTRYCGLHKCIFTARQDSPADAAAILFYASNLDINDLPLPRKSTHLWALLHEESPRNVPFIPHASVLQHFNFTSTFSRLSDHPLTLQYLPHLQFLTQSTYLVPVGEKTLLRRAEQVSAIAFIQSDCDTVSGRDEYVRQLMQYIPIDSYGKCLHNRDLPESLAKDYVNSLYAPELLRLLAKYKFIIAYENGVCVDYITEKFWRPLVVGAIPIYFGAPTIKDWQPNEKSVIHIADFSGPAALADFIKQLDQNDTEYNTYLKHKYDLIEPISNKRLRDEFVGKDFSWDSNIFTSFECAVCRQLYEMAPQVQRTATLEHYNCSLPVAHPPMESTSVASSDDTWAMIMTTGRCQAHVLNLLLQRNTNYTRLEFDTRLNRAFEANECN